MKDATLGGYLSEHERPPAFRARDGESYTVEIVSGRDEDEGDAWYAYLLFPRWEEGAVTGHVESDYLVEASTEAEAREAIASMTLQEVRSVLDSLVPHG